MNYKIILLLCWVFISNALMAQPAKDYNYYLQRGNELLRNRKGKEALPMFDSAIMLKPKSPDAFVGRGRAKAMDVSMMDGMADYDTAILYADAKDKLAYFELKEERVSGKITFYYEPASTGKRKLPIAFISFPHTNLKGDDRKLPPQYVMDIFNKAIDLYPNLSKPYIDRSIYYLLIQMIDEAIVDAKKAIEIDHSPTSYLNLCNIMRQYTASIPNMEPSKVGLSKGYTNEEILKVFDESVQNNSTNPKSYEDRAAFYECLSLLDKAKNDYDKAIALKPNFSNYYKIACLKWKINESDSNRYSTAEIVANFNNALALASSPEQFLGTDYDNPSYPQVAIKKHSLYRKMAGFYVAIKNMNLLLGIWILPWQQ